MKVASGNNSFKSLLVDKTLKLVTGRDVISQEKI